MNIQDDRRQRYAAAASQADGQPWHRLVPSEQHVYLRVADAVISVADEEMQRLRTERDQWKKTAHRMAGELGLIPKEQKAADGRLPEQDTAIDKLLADGNQALLERLAEAIDVEAGLRQILDRGGEKQ